MYTWTGLLTCHVIHICVYAVGLNILYWSIGLGVAKLRHKHSPKTQNTQ